MSTARDIICMNVNSELIMNSSLSVEEITDYAVNLVSYDTDNAADMKTFRNYIINEIMDDPSLEQIRNYCNYYGYDYDKPDDMGLFNEYFMDTDPIEIANMVSHTNFDTHDDYFWFNGSGVIRSGNKDDIVNLWCNVKDWLYDNPEYLEDVKDGETEELMEERNSKVIISAANNLILNGY